MPKIVVYQTAPVWFVKNECFMAKIYVCRSLLVSDRVIGCDIKMTSHPNSNASFINIWDRQIWRDRQNWRLHPTDNINSTPTPNPEVPTPIPTPADLQNINSNSWNEKPIPSFIGHQQPWSQSDWSVSRIVIPLPLKIIGMMTYPHGIPCPNFSLMG